MLGSIKREGDEVVIRLPADDAHSLCVALQPCPCKATKSNATANIRTRLAKGLMRAVLSKSVQRHALHNSER